MSAWAGYVGAFIAVMCFGSNYVPMKYHDTGDGLTFQWIMCSGILSVGYISLSWAKSLVWQWPGLIGGALWACGGALVIPIIRLAGLGVGFLVWSLANLVFSYIYGRFGIFGLQKAEVLNEYFSVGGILLAVVALVVFFFIDGSEDEKVEVIEEYQPFLKDDSADGAVFCGEDGLPLANSAGEAGGSQQYIVNSTYERRSSSASYHSISSSEPVQVDEYSAHGGDDVEAGAATGWRNSPFIKKAIKVANQGVGRRLLGTFMAALAGLCYSVAMVPFTVWSDKHKDAGPVDYVFTQYSGIWLMSTILFLVYSILVRPPKFYPKATLASYICGVGWGVASAAWMVSIKNLGFVVGYPIVVVGPILVTSFWSMAWFREVKGLKNITLFLISDGLIIIAIAMIVMSKVKQVEF